MSWRRMAQPVFERVDRALTVEFADVVARRVHDLPDDFVCTEAPEQLASRVRDGWETYPFPDLSSAATVRCHLGWAYTHLGTGFNADRWAPMPADRRRRLLIDLMSSTSFALPTLGAYVEALWASGPRSRLASGAWGPLAGRMDPDTYEAAQFLIALGGVPPISETLHLVGGTPPLPASPDCHPA